MSNELTTTASTGLTLTASLINGVTVQATGIVLTETPVAGFYAGSVPLATPANTYTVIVSSLGAIIASGLLYWDGLAEALAPVNLVKIRGQQVNGAGTGVDPWRP